MLHYKLMMAGRVGEGEERGFLETLVVPFHEDDVMNPGRDRLRRGTS